MAGHGRVAIDLTGQRFGRLEVLYRNGSTKHKKAIWHCKCDCGNEKITTGNSLRYGNTLSCGCLNSKGEQKIQAILLENNIIFETQKTFQDLRSDKNYPLFFDFYLTDYNILIEYQGIQHYICTNTWWNTKDNFESLQKRDNLKRDYCQLHNIRLVEIPYTDFDKINWNYLKEKCNL